MRAPGSAKGEISIRRAKTMNKTKWYHRRILRIPVWAIGLILLIAAAAYAQQQTLQLTTYYPAPYGEYTQMRVAERLDVIQNGLISVGQAFLSSGADTANLANNEWFNGSS